jgi:hypothetical protein
LNKYKNCKAGATAMQKAIKCSKTIAWIGIILNAIILLIIFILYNGYFESLWFVTALHILSPIAVIAEVMMFGGIVVKAVLEYKSGVRLTKRDFIIILVMVAVVGIYYLIKSLFLNA